MANIAVIHPYFHSGGAESVCFHIIESLQDRHRVNVYSLNHPDYHRLNELFGTNVKNVTTHVPQVITNGLCHAETVINGLSDQIGLQLALISGRYESEWDKYDLRICTHGELALSEPAIQYMHHPILNRWSGGSHFTIKNITGQVLNRVLTSVIGAKPSVVTRSRLLTNSDWTGDQIYKIYNMKPEVLYPPINTKKLSQIPWSDQDNGFVCVGRVSEDKQTHRAIDILKMVRQMGHKLHLHIVGSIDPKSEYGGHINRACEQEDWISIEGEVSREKLSSLLINHKWAIHTKPKEHFGMAVAEHVSAGSVPFVPDSGGQTEIISHDGHLCYKSNIDAAKKIEHCLSDKKMVDRIQTILPDIEKKYGKKRFRRKLNTIVEEVID